MLQVDGLDDITVGFESVDIDRTGELQVFGANPHIDLAVGALVRHRNRVAGAALPVVRELLGGALLGGQRLR